MLSKFIVKHVDYQDRIHFHTNYPLRMLTAILAVLSLLSAAYEIWHGPGLSVDADAFLLGFGGLAVVFLLLERLSFTVFFLLATFTLLTAWRLAALAGYQLSEYLYLITGMLVLLNFFIAAANDCLRGRSRFPGKHNTPYEWQLLFIRMYVGYDLVPHFSEKLFAGHAIRLADVHAFTQLGVPHPLLMVILAGFIECFGALALSCGILTRFASVCLCIYLLVSTFLGHHFSNTFIWASPGGGWEYPVLWAVLVVSFAVFGAGTFSIDEVLKERVRLPRWVKAMM